MKTNYRTSSILRFLVLLVIDSGLAQVHNDEPVYFSSDFMMVEIENGRTSPDDFQIWKVSGDLRDHPDEGAPYLNISAVSVHNPTKSENPLGPVSYAFAWVYKSKHINKLARGSYRVELYNVLFPSLDLQCSIKFNSDLTRIAKISASFTGGVLLEMDTTTHSRKVQPLYNPSWRLRNN